MNEQDNQAFYGIYETSGGAYIDLATGEEVSMVDCERKDCSPFYGVFIDKDGNEHDLIDLFNGLKVSWKQIKYDGIVVLPSSGPSDLPINQWLSIRLIPSGGLVSSYFASTSTTPYTLQFCRTSNWGSAGTEGQNTLATLVTGSPVQIENNEGYGGNTIDIIYSRFWELNLCYDIHIYTKMNGGNAEISIRVISRD